MVVTRIHKAMERRGLERSTGMGYKNEEAKKMEKLQKQKEGDR
jgi:hypothetical protein